MYRNYLASSHNHISDGCGEWGLFVDHDNDRRSFCDNTAKYCYKEEGEGEGEEFECDLQNSFIGSLLFMATIGFIRCLYNL